MIRYLQAALRRLAREGRLLTLLTVAGVALGVAAVVGIQLLNRNALAAFAGGMEAVGGEADLTVLPRSGFLDERLYPVVLGTPGVRAAWPLLRVEACLLPERRTWLEIVGTDLFAPVRLPWREGGVVAADTTAVALSARALAVPGWAALSPDLARELGVAVGDSLVVAAGSRPVVLRVGALVDFRRIAPLAPARLVVMDIARAQDLLGRTGQLDEIDLQVAPGIAPATVAARLASRLGPAVRVVTPEQRRRRTAGLLSAFRLNLTALSLVSVLVGTFLVYSTVLAMLVRRRREFGLLRAVGATATQTAGVVLAEAILLGTAGALLGIPLGIRLAVAYRGLVSGTLTSIYLLEAIERIVVPGWIVPLALAIGVGGAAAGAFLPVVELVRRDTYLLLKSTAPHEATSRRAPWYALAGLLVLAVDGGWFLAAGHRWRGGGFVLGLGMLTALPLAAPLLLRLLTARLRPRGLGAGYALKNLGARLQTSATAVAALGVAVSMLVGVTLLIASFRGTLDTWLLQTLPADVYVTTAAWDRGRQTAVMEPGVVRQLVGDPDLLGADRLRQVLVDVADRRVRFNGLHLGRPDSTYHVPMWRGTSREALASLRRGGVVISEPLARRSGLGIGDTLVATGRSGEVPLPVSGICYDYSTEHGLAYVSLATLERIAGPGPINNVALYVRPGVSVEAFIARLRRDLSAHALSIRSNLELRRQVTDIFDQTFAVTRLLRSVALLIAVAGVALALLIQGRERAADLALHRALGATRWQMVRVLAIEGTGIGLLGAACGLVGGLGLALLLIHVINPAWFGWSIRPVWAWGLVFRQLASIPVAALLASLPPALAVSRVSARELSRDDC